MKVCMAAPQTISMISGGPQTQLHQIAKYLPEFGVEVQLFDQWKVFCLPPSIEQTDRIYVNNLC